MTTDLPSPRQRWTVLRKAAVIEAVRNGLVSIERVAEVYNISVDEFRAWERDFNDFGVYGLRSTRAQIYRDARLKQAVVQPPRRPPSIAASELPLTPADERQQITAGRPDALVHTLDNIVRDETSKDLMHLAADAWSLIQEIPVEKRAALARGLLGALGLTTSELLNGELQQHLTLSGAKT